MRRKAAVGVALIALFCLNGSASAQEEGGDSGETTAAATAPEAEIAPPSPTPPVNPAGQGAVVRPPLAEAASPKPGVTPAAVFPPETVWLDDEMAPTAKAEGSWIWDTTTVASGAKSHGHPSAKGLNAHTLAIDPATIPVGGMVTQQVWLDPADPPKGIMLKFRLTTGEQVGVYWEGEEEVFTPTDEEEVWYYGLLPELGKWTTLEVLAEDLGLEEEQVAGLSFVTFDGRALWDKTVLTQAPPMEELESLPGAPPSPLTIED